MIDGIKTRVCPIDRKVKRQQMQARKRAGKLLTQQVAQSLQSTATQTVDISDELNLVLHRLWEKVSQRGKWEQNGTWFVSRLGDQTFGGRCCLHEEHGHGGTQQQHRR